MKILSAFLMISGLMVFSGCSSVVYEPVEVLVPIATPCAIEAPQCDYTKVTDTALITEMRLCVRRYKAALHYCTH